MELEAICETPDELQLFVQSYHTNKHAIAKATKQYHDLTGTRQSIMLNMHVSKYTQNPKPM
jgi:hypothetical protein